MATLFYRLLDSKTVLRLNDGVLIPVDLGNLDYQQYFAWVVAGNSAGPATGTLLTVDVAVTPDPFQALSVVNGVW